MIEGVQLATLFVISRSNVSHSSRFLIHPTRTQEAEMQQISKAIKTRKGTNAIILLTQLPHDA